MIVSWRSAEVVVGLQFVWQNPAGLRFVGLVDTSTGGKPLTSILWGSKHLVMVDYVHTSLLRLIAGLLAVFWCEIAVTAIQMFHLPAAVCWHKRIWSLDSRKSLEQQPATISDCRHMVCC
jgi:hypothetical protein